MNSTSTSLKTTLSIEIISICDILANNSFITLAIFWADLSTQSLMNLKTERKKMKETITAYLGSNKSVR